MLGIIATFDMVQKILCLNSCFHPKDVCDSTTGGWDSLHVFCGLLDYIWIYRRLPRKGLYCLARYHVNIYGLIPYSIDPHEFYCADFCCALATDMLVNRFSLSLIFLSFLDGK